MSSPQIEYLWLVSYLIKGDFVEGIAFRTKDEAIKYVEFEMEGDDEFTEEHKENPEIIEEDFMMWEGYRAVYNIERIKFMDL